MKIEISDKWNWIIYQFKWQFLNLIFKVTKLIKTLIEFDKSSDLFLSNKIILSFNNFPVSLLNELRNIAVEYSLLKDEDSTEIEEMYEDLISNSFLKKNFIGFIEPNKITSGYCDIMISDGYTGNIMIKTAEGMSDFITSNLKNVFVKSFTNKIAYKILENDLKNFRDQINPEKYNGATLIGLNGISVKSHGNATPYAFSCALSKCYDFVVNDLNKKIVETFNNL